MTLATYPDVSEILKNPGFLFWNPVGFASEAQYGTKLGYCEAGVDFAPNWSYTFTTEEETGDEIQDVLYLGASPVLSATLANFNTASLARMFPGGSGTNTAYYPGSTTIGNVISSSSTICKPVLFVPENTSYPCLLLQKAVPKLDSAWVIKMSHVQKMLYRLSFHGISKTRDVDGAYYLGAISGATLR